MNTTVFIIAGFLVALFAALCTAYFFIYKPRIKEKRAQLLRKIGYLAIAGTMLVCLFAIILPLLRNDTDLKDAHSTIENSDSFSHLDESVSRSVDTSMKIDYRYLTEEQTRKEIGESLRIGDVDKAISLLDYLANDDARDEEHEHIFNYCIKNGKLEKAKELAELFRSLSKREEAKQQLYLELLKAK